MALSGFSAAAATVNYTLKGVIDTGALTGLSFSGTFGFDDSLLSSNPDWLPLSSISVDFNGQTYALAGANPDATVSFDAGSVLGVDVTWGDDTQGLFLSTGFGDPRLGDPDGNAGSYTVTAATVPEPSTWLLGLAGLAVMGAVMRRR